MSFGMLSVFASIGGNFMEAAWFLVCALGCDILDGRVARMTHTTSDFGMQLDSLSDLVSFGIAPAILMYMLSLENLGKLGMAISVLYVLCSALRLARFNVMAETGLVHKHFIGLPTPAAAGIIISFVLSYKLVGPDHILSFKTIPMLMQTMPYFFKAMPFIMIALSFLMVSNISYMSFKKMDLSLNRPKTIRLLVVLIVFILLVIVYPQNIFFIIFFVYALSGLLMYVSRFFFRKKKRRAGSGKEGKQDKAIETEG
jgi:CDP-diacylglycerol--serine O-phosphatidyltransferase